ncbi:MAG: apolipoprotein N-acyltransferase, partial [Spirochaetaceae bacterium]|nr:apolipoprotein N-acyltransferase [Spirochaetaceae bacterium]
MRRILQVFYVFFSAIIVSVAIQNEFISFGSPFLGLFALVPLYLALRNSKSYKESSLLTGLQVTLVHLFSSFWLGNFQDFAIFTLGGSALATGVIGMAFGLLLHFVIALTDNENAGLESSSWFTVERVLMFAAIWTLYEWTKSNGFLAYPWGTILMTAYKWPVLTQIVSITGVWGLSFLLSLFSAVIGEGIALIPSAHPGNRKNCFYAYKYCGAFCIVLFCLTGVYGALEYTKERTPVKNMDTVLVQQNIDSWLTTDKNVIDISTKLTKAGVDKCISETGSKPDLVVWSEAVLSYAFPDAINYYTKRPKGNPLIPFIQETGVPFVIGAPFTLDKRNQQYGNSAILFDANGEFNGFFAKMHLVPFAEVIPGMEHEWVRNLLKKVVGISSGWTPGKYLTMFDIPL